MTPQESREIFIDAILTDSQRKRLNDQGLYQRYTEGKVSVEEVYKQLKDQGL
jgi:hypothetical protein